MNMVGWLVYISILRHTLKDYPACQHVSLTFAPQKTNSASSLSIILVAERWMVSKTHRSSEDDMHAQMVLLFGISYHGVYDSQGSSLCVTKSAVRGMNKNPKNLFRIQQKKVETFDNFSWHAELNSA